MTIIITNDIPAPAPDHNSSGLTQALRDLQVGQSFPLPVDKRRQLSSYIWRVKHYHPLRRFKMETRFENGVKVVRCWRIEDVNHVNSPKVFADVPSSTQQHHLLNMPIGDHMFFPHANHEQFRDFVESHPEFKWLVIYETRQHHRQQVKGILVYKSEAVNDGQSV